eukprot:XP_001705280.1 Hypothetical protein GL50803_35458 [Giardia lamblia ATCC 50803]
MLKTITRRLLSLANLRSHTSNRIGISELWAFLRGRLRKCKIRDTLKFRGLCDWNARACGFHRRIGRR